MKAIVIAPLLAFLVATALGAGAENEILATRLGGSPDNQIVLRIDPTPESPRNEPGAFIKLKSGRILASYGQFYGGENDFSAGRIMAIYSDDGGRTWGGSQVMVDNGSNLNVMCSSLLRLASGKIMLIYITKKTEIDCRIYMRTSSDEGATWSLPKAIVDTPDYNEIRNDCAIQTWKGRIIVPHTSYRVLRPVNNGFTSVDTRGILLWSYSDDDGENWLESPTWWTIPSINSAGQLSVNGLEEPGIVQLADGSLFSWARTDQGAQYGCRSVGGGNNGDQIFSAPEPTELKSPFSPADIKRVPNSSALFAVFNDHSGRFPFKADSKDNISGRTPLVAAISDDGGRTWPVRKVLEGDVRGAYSYPGVFFVDDHTVLIAYSAEDYGQSSHLGQLRFRRIDLSWVRAGQEKK